MTSKITNFLKVFVPVVIISLAVSYASADTGTWSNPGSGCTPTTCNTMAPVNIGSLLQQKLGALYVNTSTVGGQAAIGFQTWGKSVFNGAVQIIDGTQGAGKVLTATDANGDVSWQTPTTTIAWMPTMSYNVIAPSNKAIVAPIGVLDPGTYIFSGKVSTFNTGGAGSSIVFFSTTDGITVPYANNSNPFYPSAITKYEPNTGSAANGTYSYSASTNPNIVFALKRSGSNDGFFTIPTETITLASKTYFYVMSDQAGTMGYVNITK